MKNTYIAKLIGPSGVVKELELWAESYEDAWEEAHENVDPLRGGWVEVTLMPDTQQSMDLCIDEIDTD
ncbi:hypothetical protein A3194_12245 [Candidatus Thiodiazotropha endoloripes]|uniref:hypothetical protein n=1 Tax=Candidatus Thiodiazotropha endoloripes TaxID=1818881 RepID=UPI00083E0E23|nr:hypothetical protein [Candidatus Thiodiazotropha endoloripes]ODB85601.1 hypothetical protein A3194_12245 [Candidatus Thiodiazotropha endoloripes]